MLAVMLAVRFATDENGQRRVLVARVDEKGRATSVLVEDGWKFVLDRDGFASLPDGAWQPVCEPLEGVWS